MTPQAIYDYFEDLATARKDIGHTTEKPRFKVMNMYDDLDPNPGIHLQDGFCMVVEDFEGRGRDVKSDNPQMMAINAFSICRSVRSEDSADARLAKDDAFKIGIKIWGKLRKDYEEAHSYPDRFAERRWLFGIDFSSIQMNSIGPVFDHSFGYRFQFNATTSLVKLMEYDPDEWDFEI